MKDVILIAAAAAFVVWTCVLIFGFKKLDAWLVDRAISFSKKFHENGSSTPRVLIGVEKSSQIVIFFWLFSFGRFLVDNVSVAWIMIGVLVSGVAAMMFMSSQAKLKELESDDEKYDTEGVQKKYEFIALRAIMLESGLRKFNLLMMGIGALFGSLELIDLNPSVNSAMAILFSLSVIEGYVRCAPPRRRTTRRAEQWVGGAEPEGAGA